MVTEQGTLVRKHGGVEFRDKPTGEIRLPDAAAAKLRVRLAPAYLPYLNVKLMEWRR